MDRARIFYIILGVAVAAVIVFLILNPPGGGKRPPEPAVATSTGSYTLTVQATSVYEGKVSKTAPQDFVGHVKGTETQLRFLSNLKGYFYLVEAGSGLIGIAYPPDKTAPNEIAEGTPMLFPPMPQAENEDSVPGDRIYTAIVSPERIESLDVLINGGESDPKVKTALNELKKLNSGTSLKVSTDSTLYSTTDKVMLAEFILSFKD